MLLPVEGNCDFLAATYKICTKASRGKEEVAAKGLDEPYNEVWQAVSELEHSTEVSIRADVLKLFNLACLDALGDIAERETDLTETLPRQQGFRILDRLEMRYKDRYSFGYDLDKICIWTFWRIE